MRDAIVSELGDTGLSSGQVRAAVAHWLQNTCNLPIPIADDDVRLFAEANGLTAPQLVAAADEANLNVAILDDLISHGRLVKVRETE